MMMNNKLSMRRALRNMTQWKRGLSRRRTIRVINTTKRRKMISLRPRIK